MADTQTTNYDLTKVEVGASKDTWGGKLNENMDKIDAAIKARADAITAINTALGTKLDALSFDADAVLALLLTVDGPTSGLDAATVAGINPSAFLQTAGLLTALLAVDGAGSGLDADLLDGNQASAFAAAVHNHDSAYLAKSGDTVTGDITRSGLGDLLYWAQTGMTSGRVFLTVSTDGDPTTLPGDIWATYT